MTRSLPTSGGGSSKKPAAKKASASKGKSSGGSASSQKRADAAASYGWSLAILNSDKELKKIFGKAVTAGYTPDRFVAEVRNTKWYQKHSDTWRQNEILRVTDPTTYKQREAAQRAVTNDVAQALGATLTSAQLDKMAHNTTMFGWNESQIRDSLVDYVHVANSGPLRGQYLGEAGKNAQALQDAAYKNGYKIPDASLNDWNKSIMRGDRTVDDYHQFVRRAAATSFPTFATELLAGADLDEIAAPYKASMARILELNDNEVNLFDPTIRKALASSDKNGKPAAMPIYDFENSLRSDARWMRTDNAHKEVLGLGRQVLTNMGLAV
jgi:hypothetical protein